MMLTKERIKAAVEAIENPYPPLVSVDEHGNEASDPYLKYSVSEEEARTMYAALRLAEKLLGEPSESMIIASENSTNPLKAIREQLLIEIEEQDDE